MDFTFARRSRRRRPGPWDHLAPDALDEVREIALLQKGVIVAIASHLLLLVAIFFFSESWRIFVGSVYLFAALAGSGCTLLYSISRQGAVSGIGLALVSLIPIVGTAVLLWTNGKASAELKQYGGPVGWFGVPWRHIPPS